MSASAKTTQAVRAFHTTLNTYYVAKSGGRIKGATALGTKPNGFVSVSSSDYVCDVEMAASRALRDYPSEKQMCQRIYMNVDDTFREVMSKKNKEAFEALTDQIEERVGQAFIDSGIYPLSKYTEQRDAR